MSAQKPKTTMLLLRCAARSARARPLGASHGVGITATNALAFSTRAETTARNAADVRDLLRTRLSLTEADLDRVERFQPAGARATVEPKLGWFQTASSWTRRNWGRWW